MHIDHAGKCPPISRQHVSDVIAARMRRIDALPAEELSPPRYVGIFAVYKKIGVEKLSVNRDVLDHFPPVQSGRRGGAEDILVLQEVTVVNLLAPSIEMAQHGSEVDAGRID